MERNNVNSEHCDYGQFLNLRVKHGSDFTLERFKGKQERKEEEEHFSPTELAPDIPDNSSQGPWNLFTKEMINSKILIKEERTDADHDNEMTAGINNEAEAYSSIKQEDHDITIKEEWDAISIEDNLIEYDIALEQLDCTNQDGNMPKSEVPDVNVGDSRIKIDISQKPEKDKKKDDSKGQLMLNMYRVTKHSHNGKENNGFLDGSNNYEPVKKSNSYKATVKKFWCNKCAKSFNSKSHLNRHEKIHLRMSGKALKVFQCHMCGAQFSRNDALTRHTLNVHCEIKQKFHACPVCGKCFRSACNVSRHSVIHGKQARHLCDSCGSSFSQQGDLRRHQAYAHGAEPPSRTHVCSICGKAYAKRTILLRHTASHIRERLLICEICGREFTRKDCLFSHIKNKHII